MIKADELLEEVNLLYKENRYQEGLELLNQAIQEDSTLYRLYFFRSLAWVETKNYDNAIDDLTKATDMRPDYFRAYYQRGKLWMSREKYGKAISDFNRAMELRPDYASTYRYLGDALVRSKDYDTAIGVLSKAIELEPDNYEIYHHRGSAWRKKGEYYNALADYKKAIDLKPDASRTLLGLALVYDALKEPELASGYFKRAYFLDFDKTQLFRVFTENFPAPFLAKEILSQEVKGLKADLLAVGWVTDSCKGWDEVLEYLRGKGYPVTHPDKYYALEAVVHYYMGDPITAYKIFDTRYDTDEYPYSLSLRDQYYLALSAMDFAEPDNGLEYAVEQARKMDSRAPLDSYYAGRLFLLHSYRSRDAVSYEDLQRALRCFDECGVFVPALYAKMAIHRWLENEEEILHLAREIAAVEAGHKVRYLEGFEPLTIYPDMSFEEIFDKIFRLIPYYELRKEIKEARMLLQISPRREYLSFYELVRLG